MTEVVVKRQLSPQHSTTGKSEDSGSSAGPLQDRTPSPNVLAAHQSFWEIGQYKRTVKRTDDGFRCCQDLQSLIKERAEIESNYAKNLSQWSRKWFDHVSKGPEYGTNEGAYKAVFAAADKLADLHTRVKFRLIEEVFNTVKIWQKDNYHQKPLGGLKESRELEDLFRKAQKDWSKLFLKAEKYKKEYHSACKAERSAINQERNSRSDESMSEEQKQKLKDKVKKCEEERQTAKQHYETALREIDRANGRYVEDMTMVFERCQDMEAKRLKFFKEMFIGMHKCLDITQDPKLASTYKNFWQSLEDVDPQDDLKWWERMHGTSMPMNWPAFEEYTPEARAQISKKQARLSSKEAKKGEPKLVAQKILEKSEPERPASAVVINGHDLQTTAVNGKSHRPASHQEEQSGTNPFETSESDENKEDECAEEEVNDDTPEFLEDTGEPGVPVRALYDYKAQDKDEMDLTKGETFDKLSEPDELGWCKGRRQGRVALYPAAYCEVLAQSNGKKPNQDGCPESEGVEC